jgi:hypothetical protein
MTTNKLLCDWLFNQIQERLQDKRKLGFAVSTTLDMSLSNAYKRISAQSKLTAEELLKLLASFDIDLQEFEGYSKNQSELRAVRPKYIADFESLGAYLNETDLMFQKMVAIKHRLYYSARDLPLFHYFLTDNLARFKHLIWLRGANFSEHSEMRMADIPERTLLNQLKQLESLVSSYVISKDEALAILDDLKLLLSEVKESCRTDSNHQIFLMPFLNMANNALLVSNAQNLVFLSFAGINYVKSTNASLCSDLKHWFNQQQLIGDELSRKPMKCGKLFRLYSSQIEDCRSLMLL